MSAELVIWADEMFKDGKPNPAAYDKLEAIRDILTMGGRTLVQGALGWIWAKSDITIDSGFQNGKTNRRKR